MLSINSRFLIAIQLAMTICEPASATNSVPKNPFLADSTYPMSHVDPAASVSTAVAAFGDIGRPLRSDEITWRPTEINDFNIRYSGKYPDGSRVAWTGGNKVLFKFDADTLQLLGSIQVSGGSEPLSAAQIEAHVNQLDQLSGKELLDVAIKPILTGFTNLMPSFYNLISNENEQYLGVNDLANKRLLVRVYGDAVKDDPASPIVVKRELVLPDVEPGKVLIFGLAMTYDGVLIVTMTDWTVFAVSRDLKVLDRIELPHIVITGNDKYADVPGESKQTGIVTSFVRNSPAIDDEGGIYIVSHDFMQRVQWTGRRLSLNEKDGAWVVRYPNGERGSGTTPTVMGFGKEDKLVTIGEGASQNLLAFWRDKIPADWKGLPGLDRRIVAQVPISFGKWTKKGAIAEITQTVRGYGAFMMNDNALGTFANDMGYQTTPSSEYFALSYGIGQGPKVEYTNFGGLKYEWNPKTRKFDFKWLSPLSFTEAVAILDGKDVLYTIGSRKGTWTIEGIDWATGKSKFHYELGKSQRFNPAGSALNIAPNGALDCACDGGFGLFRVMPVTLAKDKGN